MIESRSLASESSVRREGRCRLRPNGSARVVVAIVLALGAYALVMRGPIHAFASAPRSVPAGVVGDQAFYLWAVERAQASDGFSAFVSNCDWSTAGCTDLRAVPQEWPFLYALGAASRLAHVGAPEALSAWYLATVLLNALAALAFVAVVSKNWPIAGAIAPLVAFQQSLLFRLYGHLALAAAWPLIGAMTALWRALEDVRDRKRRRLALDVAALFALLLATAFGSHYYLLFGALLLPAVVGAFLLLNPEVASTRGLRRREWVYLIGSVALAAAVFVAVRHANRPLERHLATEQRPLSDVVACSAQWRDYVQPTPLSGAAGLFRKLDLAFPESAIGARWKWELHAFLGATLLGAVVITAGAFIVSRVRRRGAPGRALDLRSAMVLVVLAVGAAFLGTGTGGRLIHAAVPAARCFNRLAPFTVLFASAAVAAAWRPRPLQSVILAALLFVAGVAEHGNAQLLGQRAMTPISKDLEFADRLRQSCRGRRVVVEPPVDDFMFGPYRIYHLAQLARCPLEGIRGPGFRAATLDSAPVASDLVLRWSEDRNGFERVLLEQTNGAGAPAIEVAEYDGG